MMIIPISTNPDIVLELHFSKDEKEHPLFNSVSGEVQKLESVEVSKSVEKEDYYIKTVTYPVNPEEDINLQLGRLVDMVREKYCGDVVSPEIQSIDTKTKEPIYEEKDYKNIPQFTLGTIEPVKELN